MITLLAFKLSSKNLHFSFFFFMVAAFHKSFSFMSGCFTIYTKSVQKKPSYLIV